MTHSNDNIFIIQNLIKNEGQVEAVVLVDAENEILKGHFPGQPVVPGACMLQLVKDVLETATDLHLQLKKADQLKFLNVIIPAVDQQLRLAISYNQDEDGDVFAQGILTNGEVVCFKFQGTFTKIRN